MLVSELIDLFLSYCSRHRTAAALAFYRARFPTSVTDRRTVTSTEAQNPVRFR